MKKTLSLFLVVLMMFSMVNPISAHAEENVLPEWQDFFLTQTEFSEIVEEKLVTQRASGLIVSYSLGIKKNGNNLIIAASTFCTIEAVKCGFKEVVIQRRADSTQEWVDYVTYEDLYNDSFSHTISKSLAVGTGYQYRATAIHYAKKNIFSTEKINNTSNTVVFA